MTSDTLRAMLRKHPIVYIEHQKIMLDSFGRYYLLTDHQVQDITHDIAEVFKKDDLSLEVKKVFNPKTGVAVKCLKAKYPETLIRDLSTILFDRWDVVKFYEFSVERIF